MKKPLIALLTNNDDDVYCFRLELIQRIIRDGYRILISCPDGPKFKIMEKEGLKRGVDYIYDNPPIDRRGTSVVKDFNLMLHYKKLFENNRPDIVLTYTAKPNVYASIVAHSLKIPVINNVTGLGSVIKKGFLKQRVIMQMFKIAYRKSECIMFQNSTNMELARNLRWIVGKAKLIPGSGVDVERFPVQDYPAGGNGIKGETVIFNYIGRILHDKGVDDYIEAAKRIKKKYPRTEFNMIGFIEPTENHYKEELTELQNQGIINYRGSQNDVRMWIKRAHAIIHPSTYGEGMSNVLLENASSGRPIITTDNAGCRETVDNGNTGFVYHGGDIDELVFEIEKFLSVSNDERKRMGLLGRKKIEQEFSRDKVVDSYMCQIDILLGR
ncbi:glycosyltransferase family 4 protein [Ligilactobacillus ruminis]|uniref:glycosyltransferase family 4 protein n=1 Tax=Ligilactobacillus ruminis TaxID=1623 RepID=UPI003F94744B